MRICPECQTLVEENTVFCDNCGLRLPAPPREATGLSEPVKESRSEKTSLAKPESSPMRRTVSGTCASCGYVNLPGEMFCQNCGVQLAPIPSTPPPPPTPITSENQSEALQKRSSVTPTSDQVSAVQPIKCLYCGFLNNAQDVFCQYCGLELIVEPSRELKPSTSAISNETSAAQRTTSPQPQHPPGKLIVLESLAEVSLPPGKPDFIVGRSDAVKNIYPDVDLTPFGGDLYGVSRLHARFIIQKPQIFIEDLNSTNYTYLNNLKLQPGQRYILRNGDELRLGMLTLQFRED